MSEQEGVIKYELVFQQTKPLTDHDYSSLSLWHSQFKRDKVLGQDPARYDGLGFGNISQRIGQHSFLISGTQTGCCDTLSPAEYALVTHADIENNYIEAQGTSKPSSEALTHAAIYALNANIRYVFHVHSPQLWNARDALPLPQTAADIPYGSPEMANEIKQLWAQGLFQQGTILAMSGHKDGIIAFGSTASEAGALILRLLAKA